MASRKETIKKETQQKVESSLSELTKARMARLRAQRAHVTYKTPDNKLHGSIMEAVEHLNNVPVKKHKLCLTPRSEYHFHISRNFVEMAVLLPENHGFNKEEARALEKKLHSAMELIVAMALSSRSSS
jgi:hypothetical protein